MVDIKPIRFRVECPNDYTGAMALVQKPIPKDIVVDLDIGEVLLFSPNVNNALPTPEEGVYRRRDSTKVLRLPELPRLAGEESLPSAEVRSVLRGKILEVQLINREHPAIRCSSPYLEVIPGDSRRTVSYMNERTRKYDAGVPIEMFEGDSVVYGPNQDFRVFLERAKSPFE